MGRLPASIVIIDLFVAGVHVFGKGSTEVPLIGASRISSISAMRYAVFGLLATSTVSADSDGESG